MHKPSDADTSSEPEHHEWEVPETTQIRGDHQWRKRGTWVTCTACGQHHGFAVPPHWELVGTDGEGQPQFVKR